MSLPFSRACVNNAKPILQQLQCHLNGTGTLLEIGSGTGQHAVSFAPKFPELLWYTSDLRENHDGIQLWLDECPAPNLRGPLALNVSQPDWPLADVDAVFTANTLHIMSWPAAQQCIRGAANVLVPGGKLIVYGPFNYAGRYTSDSNASFDQWLKARDSASGIRDFEAVRDCASDSGLSLLEDTAMPANNRCLVFQKQR